MALPSSPELVELEQARADYARWQQIAARQAAIQIYNILILMEKLRGYLRRTPTLLGLTDIPTLRDAHRTLTREFRQYRLLRDASAHSYFELTTTLKEADAHRADIPDGAIPGVVGAMRKGIFTNSLVGNRYFVTKDKTLASVEISAATLDKLKAGVLMFTSAFRRGMNGSAPVCWPITEIGK